MGLPGYSVRAGHGWIDVCNKGLRFWSVNGSCLDLRDRCFRQVTLFERYTERADRPFAVFVATLHGRAGGGLPPPVAKAFMHIRLHLGMLRRLLYWVRSASGTLLPQLRF